MLLLRCSVSISCYTQSRKKKQDTKALKLFVPTLAFLTSLYPWLESGCYLVDTQLNHDPTMKSQANVSQV